MKKILTILLCFNMGFAISQTSVTSDAPTSYSEINSADFPTNITVDKSDPIITPSDDSRTPLGLTYYTDRGVFDIDNPGLPIETWASSLVGANSFCSDLAPLNEFTNDGCFSTGDVLPGIEVNQVASVSSNKIYVLLTTGFLSVPFNVSGPVTFADDLVLSFDPPVRAIGMDIVLPLHAGSFIINIYDENGVNLGSPVFTVVGMQSFWGVNSDTRIGELVFENSTEAGELVGNVAFGNSAPPVPLSNWPIYVGILLIGVFIIVRYRKKLAIG